MSNESSKLHLKIKSIIIRLFRYFYLLFFDRNYHKFIIISLIIDVKKSNFVFKK